MEAGLAGVKTPIMNASHPSWRKTRHRPNLLPVPPQFIERRIYLIRGQKVMLDSDLADLYQVERNPCLDTSRQAKRQPLS